MDLLAGAATFTLVLAILLFARDSLAARRTGVQAALKRFTDAEGDLGLQDAGRKRKPQEGRLGSLLGKINLVRRLEQMIWQAGLQVSVAEVLLIIVLLFGTGEVVGGSVWSDTLFAIALGGVLATLPIFYIRFRKKRRLALFAQQLPYALDLIKSSLEAGHSLLRGIQVVVGEFRDPIATEFSAVLEQTRLGFPLPRALEEMLKRVPEEDLRLMVVAVKVQAEVGSSLAGIIGRLSELMRLRQRLYQQIRALTAQSRMSGIIVGLLPVLVLAAFSMIQPGYANALFYDPTGVKMLKAAVGLDLMAVFTIRRLLKVDF
jgi:tight adherence protein B